MEVKKNKIEQPLYQKFNIDVKGKNSITLKVFEKLDNQFVIKFRKIQSAVFSFKRTEEHPIMVNFLLKQFIVDFLVHFAFI